MLALIFKNIILIHSLLCLKIRNAYFTVDFGAVGRQNLNRTSIRYLSSLEFLSLPAHLFPPRYAALRETVFSILQHCRNPTD